ncbi:MAG: hypothetical protein V1745_00675 [Patescibacteria group bacterium]
MIRYGLKLRSDNASWFTEARRLFDAKRFDVIELAHHPDVPVDELALEPLRDIPMTVHAPTDRGFHEFIMGEEQLVIWRETLHLADLVRATSIIVHPGLAHTVDSFFENLAKIDDPRMLIENMAGLDLYGNPMFGQRLDDLATIRTRKPVCFDIEKAVKAATHQGRPWQEFLEEGLRSLQPSYFHISGGDASNPMDEHDDLWTSTYDVAAVKRMLERISNDREISLIFEVPKKDGTLENDMRNMEHFRGL